MSELPDVETYKRYLDGKALRPSIAYGGGSLARGSALIDLSGQSRPGH
jgi:hypothetical protein